MTVGRQRPRSRPQGCLRAAACPPSVTAGVTLGSSPRGLSSPSFSSCEEGQAGGRHSAAPPRAARCGPCWQHVAPPGPLVRPPLLRSTPRGAPQNRRCQEGGIPLSPPSPWPAVGRGGWPPPPPGVRLERRFTREFLGAAPRPRRLAFFLAFFCLFPLLPPPHPLIDKLKPMRAGRRRGVGPRLVTQWASEECAGASFATTQRGRKKGPGCTRVPQPGPRAALSPRPCSH